jgi:chorismate mutase/prephenate dehydratase
MTDSEKNHSDLSGFRQQIDSLDAQIVKLLNDRARVVVEIGDAKRETDAAVYDPDREQNVLRRIAELNGGPLQQGTLKAIYRELMSGSLALEKPLRVGYLGPEGSFSHQTAMRKFGASVEYEPLADIAAVFEEVERKRCHLGIVPVENTTGGDVVDTLDCFVDSHVVVVAEVMAEVHHNLLANCKLEDITAIASKPEVFAQCRQWLANQGRRDNFINVASSARAVKMAAEEKGLAAIGSALAGELYGVNVVFANIEDNPHNRTRFFVIGKDSAPASGQDRTAMMFTTSHKAGALAEALGVFSQFGINLSNIASRPSRRRQWEYFFFIETEGHIQDDNVAKAIEAAREHCGEMHVLGSFPQAREAL